MIALGYLENIASRHAELVSKYCSQGFSNLQPRYFKTRSRADPSRDDSPSRHPEVLLFRIWAWVSAKDGLPITNNGQLFLLLATDNMKRPGPSAEVKTTDSLLKPAFENLALVHYFSPFYTLCFLL
ncbi:hypothetical protein [Mesotoga sp.]|uniref:hypothetical protein n=1 Tax=Mesotoga sp. TaxID=2053577 RepID=UPI00345E6D1A